MCGWSTLGPIWRATVKLQSGAIVHTLPVSPATPLCRSLSTRGADSGHSSAMTFPETRSVNSSKPIPAAAAVALGHDKRSIVLRVRDDVEGRLAVASLKG